MIRSFTLAAAALASCVTGAAQTAPGGYVGWTACAGCHPDQAGKHEGSGHARSLSRPLDHRLAEKFHAELKLQPGFDFEIDRDKSDLVVRARDANESRQVVVDWAFGAGDMAVTFVSQVDEDWYLEHHWSYFSAADGFDTTPGHQHAKPEDLGQAIGVMYRTFSPSSEILRCFRCHSTGPISLGENFEIQPSETGVRCEGCHGPGEKHVAAIAAGEIEQARKALVNPGRLSPPELIQHCGGCHRPPSQDPSEIDYGDPWNVRHVPIYLSRSACFTESGTMTCMTCHDPHARARLNDFAYYNERCLGCHTKDSLPVSDSCAPADKAGCESCHMPKVWPHESLRFTNHWIGVFENGETLIPRR